ncbi:MAG: hypothetical protein HQL97_06045 [Magnetococcales bacterium]|nr:hypothetical protein [Magnetococcales bacterium]
MNPRQLVATWRTNWRKVLAHGRKLRARADALGWREALRVSVINALRTQAETVPLASYRTGHYFQEVVSHKVETARAQRRAREAEALSMHDASNIDQIYPLVFHHGDRLIRYTRLPATRQSRGLIVFFHGFNAWFHTGPLRPFEQFDLLAPWDTFGWKRQGSWFWGEKGNGFVAEMVQALIRREWPDSNQPLFCMGSSMGGYGALYHGITLGCRGIYVMAPQVDLKAKIEDYGLESRANPYGFLRGESLDSVPDLCAIADEQATLPPLFLIQDLYDPVNEFPRHAERLLACYHRKRAWYGLRVHPGARHDGDGSQAEAELFFSLVLDRQSG